MIDRLGLPVGLPGPFTSGDRVGPFPSGAGALRFLIVGGLGAVFALAWEPLVWIPFLAGGLILGTQRVDGEWIDERLAAGVRWRVRRRGRSPTRGRALTRVREGIGRLSDGRYAAGFIAGGIPIAFLARPEAERIFLAFRDALRHCELTVRIRVDRAPLGLRPLPRSVRTASSPVTVARTGYEDLLQLLVRRRRRREVLWIVLARGGGEGLARLEGHMDGLSDLLAALEVPARRLGATELGALLDPPRPEGRP